MRSKKADRPRALGAYIFAGGFTLGVQDHFDVVGHLEDGPYGVATTRKAQETGHFKSAFPIFDAPDRWPWEDYVDRVDLLYGNPPCAAWSPLGPRAQRGLDAWKKDPRVDCTRGHFNLAELVRPRVWAWESVPQAYSTGRPFVEHLTERAVKLEYAVDFVLHNAMHLGAHQSRRRFFMVATTVNVDWSCPWLPCLSGSDALATLPAHAPPDGHAPDHYYEKMFMKMVKPGEALRAAYPAYLEKVRQKFQKKHGKEIPEDLRSSVAPRPSFGERRLPSDRPAGAIVDSLIIHPTEERYLTIAELGHLGGWPVDYPLEGGGVDARSRLLTRAVLPPVGRWFAGEVARGLQQNRTAPPGRVREINLYQPPGSTALVREAA
jgi:site-specific DNA-cytosine methylase